YVDSAKTSAQAASTQLDAAIAGATLLPSTDGKDAQVELAHALAQIEIASAKLAALVAAGASSAKPVTKPVDKALTSVDLALGELNGFKSKSTPKQNTPIKATLL